MQIARSSHAATRKHNRSRQQLDRMQTQPRSTWGFRIRFMLGAILALGWGFLLGVALVRANASLSYWYLAAVVPLTYFGSALVSFAFHRALPEWHKMARLLIVLLFSALAMPLGLLWALSEWELDAVQLVAATGAEVWDAEWIIAIVGLIGGTWTGWTNPPRQWLARGLGALLERPTRFIENVGRAILWLPLMLIELAVNLIHGVGLFVVSVVRGIASVFTAVGSNAAGLMPRQNRVRFPRMHLPRARRRANQDGAARIVSVVEERCPYCLDVVKRNDPRGVKVCEVCRTPHHADCWAITGKCQVPHLNV